MERLYALYNKPMLIYQKLLQNIMPQEPVYHLRFVLRPLKSAPDYASVYIRLEYGGEFTDFGVTGVKVKKKGFSNFIPQKSIEVSEKVSEPKLVTEIKKIMELIQKNHPSNAKLIKNYYKGIAVEHYTLIDLMKKCLNENEKLKRKETKKSWISKIKILENYLVQSKNSKILAMDFTPVEVNKFINYLKNAQMKDSSILVFKGKICSCMDWAYNKGFIRECYLNGYKPYGIQRPTPKPRGLDWSFIENIQDYDFEDDRMNRARDMFVFCSYVGLSYVDLQNASNQLNLQDKEIESYDKHINQNVRYYITGERIKTSDEEQDVERKFETPLWGKSIDILKKYKCLSKICTIDNSSINKIIKHCFERVGVTPKVTKKITFHVSRHTFCQYLHDLGMKGQDIIKRSGHSNEKALQYYVKIKFDESLIKYKYSEFIG